MNIFLTNDDGVNAPGINILFEFLKAAGYDVIMVAPHRDNSAISHSISLGRDLLLKKIAENRYSINGTPSDCVMLGLKCKVTNQPDLLISGVNRGGNMGEDVHYSGTVAAAIEGSFAGISSIAISVASKSPKHYKAILPYMKSIIELSLKSEKNTILNINYPDMEQLKEIKWSFLGRRIYLDNVECKKMNDGNIKIINHPSENVQEKLRNSDFWAVQNGYISISPISVDWTDYKYLKGIE
ncbi:5'/3'-nucleotidase SurE [bacterium]|nr:5'/3'-nucleotidase SurE [bacterium]